MFTCIKILKHPPHPHSGAIPHQRLGEGQGLALRAYLTACAAMTDLQPPQSGFVRLSILLDKPCTPGDLAKACGVDLDHLGPIVIDGDQALVDVTTEEAPVAREGLKTLGATQLQSRGKKPDPKWAWLRMAVGRNHGMTIGQFRRIMERSPCGPLGKIHLNNTHTLVGIHEEIFNEACSYFADMKINGIAVRPGRPEQGEVTDGPMYLGNKE